MNTRRFRIILMEAFRIVNRNWQLVFVQLASLFISFISFFVIVGTPIAVAFIIFGLDLTDMLKQQDIAEAIKGSAALFSKYFGIALVILLSLVFYLVFNIMLWIFTIGGTVGIIKDYVVGGIKQFSLKQFYWDGRKFFISMLIFTTVIGLIFTVIAFLLGLMGSSAYSISNSAADSGSKMLIFLSTFLYLLLISAGILLIVVSMALIVFGIANIVFNRMKAVETIKATTSYLYENPFAILFYGLLIFGYASVVFLAVLIGSSFTAIPFIGTIMTFPYQITLYMVQAYMNLVMFAAVFIYFRETGYEMPAAIDDLFERCAGKRDILSVQDDQHMQSLDQKDQQASD
ncbi:MAG: hypothetical protein RBT37_08470 [Dissulfurispiraceae bacterium]|nr:hypothetical protein [Dissulfurispiraceae bacterium]